MLPEKSQGKVLQATVVAIGSGSKGKKLSCIRYPNLGWPPHVRSIVPSDPGQARSVLLPRFQLTCVDGNHQPVSVKVGEKVLLPEYGGTKVVLGDKDYFIFRDGDILGKYVD
ncbi:UNVERIFIED_CONTAM: hypothetical protein K2H54_053241 [Gekko kuhli]